MRVELSAYVEPDLDEIAAYIAADHPARAVSFIPHARDRLKPRPPVRLAVRRLGRLSSAGLLWRSDQDPVGAASAAT